MSERLENQRQQPVEFVRLFTDCSQRLHTYVSILIPDENAAADLFQDVSVTLWERFSQFEPGTDFWAWAKQIAYYKVLNHRTRKRHPLLTLSDELFEELAVEADTASEMLAERKRALSDCLSSLPAFDRKVLECRYAPGATTDLAAQNMGQSLHQVYRALRRIHQVLFECINQKLAGDHTDGIR